MDIDQQGLERSVRLYPFFALCSSANFWQPVFFLYFIQHMSLSEVLRLEAIYYVSVVILEVPSGYFSDVVGRRVTLMIAGGATVVACAFFLWGHGFWTFALAQMALATGMAFRSGTDTSFHFDVLNALGREGEYDKREAWVSRQTFWGAALAALIGGWVASYALFWAYVLSLFVACGALIVAIRFVEPPQVGRSEPTGLVQQIGACLFYLRQPFFLWLMVFVIFMTVMNHIPYEFYQPYIGLLQSEFVLPTPMVTGLHTAVTLLVAGWVAKYSIVLRDRLGLGATLLSAGALQVVMILLMAVMLHPVVVVLLVMRSTPRALMTAPLNAAIVPRLKKMHRATYLSVQSLLGRLAFSGTLGCLSIYAGPVVNWQALSVTLTVCLGFGLMGLLGLFFTMRLALHDVILGKDVL